MDLDYLRLIVLDERASGKLAEISHETFTEAAEYLREIYDRAKSLDVFMTQQGRELLDESDSIRSTLQEISSLRMNKIIKLALVTVQGDRTYKEELKRMLPEEREMFDEILDSVKECRDRLIEPENEMRRPVVTGGVPAGRTESGEEFSGGDDEFLEEEPGEDEENPVYEPSYLLEDIDSFMGIDGRIYTLSKEDIVMLPAKNASVLYSRNIALNIRVGK